MEGKLRYSAWEAKDGSKRSKLEIAVDDIEFMSKQAPVTDVYDDSIPF